MEEVREVVACALHASMHTLRLSHLNPLICTASHSLLMGRVPYGIPSLFWVFGKVVRESALGPSALAAMGKIPLAIPAMGWTASMEGPQTNMSEIPT